MELKCSSAVEIYVYIFLAWAVSVIVCNCCNGKMAGAGIGELHSSGSFTLFALQLFRLLRPWRFYRRKCAPRRPAAGMMDPAYFVGRRAILDWLNNTFHMNLAKIEETASGAETGVLSDESQHSIGLRIYPVLWFVRTCLQRSLCRRCRMPDTGCDLSRRGFNV